MKQILHYNQNVGQHIWTQVEADFAFQQKKLFIVVAGFPLKLQQLLFVLLLLRRLKVFKFAYQFSFVFLKILPVIRKLQHLPPCSNKKYYLFQKDEFQEFHPYDANLCCAVFCQFLARNQKPPTCLSLPWFIFALFWQT